MVLQAFKDRGGFDTLNNILEVFTDEIRSSTLQQTDNQDKSTEEFRRFGLATTGTQHILKLYSDIVNGKNVTESIQTMSMNSRSNQDRNRSDHFSPAQFLVELRMAVIPTIRNLWGSDLIQKGSSQISEKLIDVIKTIATADGEGGALKRSDKVINPSKHARKTFKPGSDYQTTCTDHGYDLDLTNEALYRCNNNIAYALEYCREMTEGEGRRNPVPEGDITSTPDATSSRPRTSTSTGTATPDDHAMSGDTLSNIINNFNGTALPLVPPPGGSDASPQNIDQLLSQIMPGLESSNNNASDQPSIPAAGPSSGPQVSPPTEEPQRKQITVDDLNEEREAIRDNLIDRCLDVINAHGEVTFEISDLITMVVNKSSDPAFQRKNVAETLVVALMSFADEGELPTCGKKIAAYAHLLALLLRDKPFFKEAVEESTELKDNLSTLLGFVKLPDGHTSNEPSPWITHILLIVEMLLSEDAKPRKTKWTPPKDENDVPEPPVLETPELSVPQKERTQLLEAILAMLINIGKDESLALAVVRILVILTRTRSVAQYLGQKKNIQRLFVMAKQLAGSSSRIQSPLMLIVRHIIEDDETVKQIMRTEIRNYLENNRNQRSVDEKTYLRGLAHTALRNPELFVEVTNEMVKLNRWTYGPTDPSSRHPPVLTLKETVVAKASDDAVQPTVQATEDLSIQEVKQSTEAVDSEMPDVSKIATHEHKLPIVDNPDGVIHFLLCELVNYREVEDKDPAPVLASSSEKTTAPTNGDVNMTGTSSTPEIVAPKDAKATKPSTKQEFKAEEHPIYIYRCFILQCLTELLQSYNRTKIEFINFKRSAPPQAMTPSKPRSSVVNYLLFDLIPTGTLDHAETTALRKKLVTSSWADSVLTALLAKTGEHSLDREREPFDSGDDEPDLLFVRKFVLENILKAYKEASSSTESLDVKYARMLSLAELMNHIMMGKENVAMTDTPLALASQKQLRRIMFEKGFISALTASIADIDLNFPGAKRAVKYILRPLKTLTNAAVSLSDLNLISTTPGQNEEDEIESATSISEPDDEREETPDLFRNSTLGMFEPGREEDSSSDSDDGMLSPFKLILLY